MTLASKRKRNSFSQICWAYLFSPVILLSLGELEFYVLTVSVQFLLAFIIPSLKVLFVENKRMLVVWSVCIVMYSGNYFLFIEQDIHSVVFFVLTFVLTAVFAWAQSINNRKKFPELYVD